MKMSKRSGISVFNLICEILPSDWQLSLLDVLPDPTQRPQWTSPEYKSHQNHPHRPLTLWAGIC